MTLVFGGAYQGKRDWVKRELGYEDSDIFTCRAGDITIETDKPVIDGLHRYILALLRAGGDPEALLAARMDRLAGKVIICEDITGGVVPVDAEMRAWREAVGRCMGLLSARADRVVRIFCGLPQHIK